MSHIFVVNYMEPLPTLYTKVWRSHQIANSFANDPAGFNVTYITSKFDHFTKSFRSSESHHLPYNLLLLSATSYKNNKSIMRYISYIIFSFSLLPVILSSPSNSLWFISYPHVFSILSAVFCRLFRPDLKVVVDIRDCPFLPSAALGAKIYNFVESILLFCSFPFVHRFTGLGQSMFLHFPPILSGHIATKYSFIPMTTSQYTTPYFAQTSLINVLFTGTLTDSFDLDASISAFVSSPNSSILHIIGDGPLYNLLSAKYSSYSNVIFYGHQPFSFIQQIAQECLYGLLPYSPLAKRYARHFTNKYPEYLSFGLVPIIPMHCTEMYEFSRDNDLGLFYDSRDSLLDLFSTLNSVSSDERLRIYNIFKRHFTSNQLPSYLRTVLEAL